MTWPVRMRPRIFRAGDYNCPKPRKDETQYPPLPSKYINCNATNTEERLATLACCTRSGGENGECIDLDLLECLHISTY
jgi:hypothetical protein